jgi:integrase
VSGGGKRRAPGRKSRTFELERRALSLDEWPARDRAAWEVAIKIPYDPFDAEGPAAHWANGTRRNRSMAWGNFLAFLASRDLLDPTAGPAERATRENVTAWITSIRSRLRASAGSKYVIDLSLAISSMEPHLSWIWIRRHPLRPRHAEAMASRKPVAPFDPGMLTTFLFARCEELEAEPVSHRRAQEYRDALIVLLDIYLGLRSANLCLLRLGVHVIEVGHTYRIDIPPEETKAGKPVSSMMRPNLAAILRTYLRLFRPALQEGHPATDRIWINRDGDPLDRHAMYGLFQRVGRRAGIELRPHLVRHTVATTLISAAPMNLGLAAAALTHNGARMVNEVYDRSGADASQALWQRLRRKMMR